MDRQQLGKFGETIAENYLKENGYQILCRNFRCRAGEIDIVASKGHVLHFIEVKTRQGSLFGHPSESITSKKKSHMKAAAGNYLAKMRGSAEKYRQIQLDVISLEIEHIQSI